MVTVVDDFSSVRFVFYMIDHRFRCVQFCGSCIFIRRTHQCSSVYLRQMGRAPRKRSFGLPTLVLSYNKNT